VEESGGWSAEEIRQLFRIINWMGTLPAELEAEFRGEMQRFEQERHMPYVTSIERLARQEGIQQGREEGGCWPALPPVWKAGSARPGKD
jgi:hypothetical protein